MEPSFVKLSETWNLCDSARKDRRFHTVPHQIRSVYIYITAVPYPKDENLHTFPPDPRADAIIDRKCIH